ncbi:MAG: HPr family phosphocarrier protein [Desulfobacteraceae bacterium]|nr:HPr family phosphocarrier protein [Desulfobacteraceae bacterium]
MNQLTCDLSRKTTVINPLGLHARPAGMIANLAINAQSDVWLFKNGEQADASSIIDILSLACVKGTDVTLKIEDPDDMNILNEIINLFEKGFGESV